MSQADIAQLAGAILGATIAIAVAVIVKSAKADF